MLDKSLPHGTVHSHPGVAFYQNGKYYDTEGYEVSWPDAQRIEKKPQAPKKAAPTPQEENEGETGDIIVDGVNLSAFARGEASDVPATKIKKAVEAHFGKKPKDLNEALKIAKGEEIA